MVAWQTWDMQLLQNKVVKLDSSGHGAAFDCILHETRSEECGFYQAYGAWGLVMLVSQA